MTKGHKVESDKCRMGQNVGWEIMTNGNTVECNEHRKGHNTDWQIVKSENNVKSNKHFSGIYNVENLIYLHICINLNDNGK